MEIGRQSHGDWTAKSWRLGGKVIEIGKQRFCKRNCIWKLNLPQHIFLHISCVNQFFLLPLHPLRNGQVFYGQLPLNPPGWERSKGIRL